MKTDDSVTLQFSHFTDEHVLYYFFFVRYSFFSHVSIKIAINFVRNSHSESCDVFASRIRSDAATRNRHSQHTIHQHDRHEYDIHFIRITRRATLLQTSYFCRCFCSFWWKFDRNLEQQVLHTVSGTVLRTENGIVKLKCHRSIVLRPQHAILHNQLQTKANWLLLTSHSSS